MDSNNNTHSESDLIAYKGGQLLTKVEQFKDNDSESERIVSSLWDMMVSTIEMDIAQKNVVSNMDLKNKEFQGMAEKVTLAHQQSFTAKQAVLDFLAGVSQTLSKISSFKKGLDLDAKLNKQIFLKKNFIQYCALDSLEKSVSTFQSFSVDNFKQMIASAQHLVDNSGSEALKAKMKESKELEEKYMGLREKVKQASSALVRAQGKFDTTKGELDFLMDEIEQNKALKERFHKEIEENQKLNRDLIKKRAEAPPSETSSGWWVFRKSVRNDTVHNIDGAMNKLDSKDEAQNRNIQSLSSSNDEIQKKINALNDQLALLNSEKDSRDQELKTCEEELKKVKGEKDLVDQQLHDIAKEKGQGYTQLLETYKVGAHFVGILEGTLTHQVFAHNMIESIRKLHEIFEYVDAADNLEEKRMILDDVLSDIPSFQLFTYLNQYFWKKFKQMIEAATKAHDIKALDMMKEEANKEEIKAIESERVGQPVVI